MAIPPRYLTFVRLPAYVKAAHGLLADVQEREVERVLCNDPQAGDTIANSGGVSKLRVKLPGKGKSGGARVIYFYRGSVGRIYLLYVYAKGEQETISAAEKREMRKLTSMLESEP